MIRLNVNEQQLFDLIMALYSSANAEGGEQDPEAVRRREVLLDKLHRAFDNKIIAPQADRSPRAVRMVPPQAHAAADSAGAR